MTTKAFVTDVQFGSMTIEGLMDEQGKYYVAVTQVAAQLLASLNNPSKDVKALLGKGFEQFLKLKTELNPNPVNVVTLEQFEVVLTKLDRKGNVKAQQLRDSLFGLSLQQLFSDAFNIKFEKAERQQWLLQREVHQCNYNDRISHWLDVDGVPHAARGYIVNQFKTHVGVDLIPVNEYNSTQLALVNEAQASYEAMRMLGANHQQALDVLYKRSSAAKYPPLKLVS